MKIIALRDLPETTTSHNAGRKKQIIGKDVIKSLTQFSQVAFLPGEVAKEHKHADMFEVFLVEKGKGTLKVNGQEHGIEQGMCFIVEPRELHEVANTGKEDLVMTYFGIVK